MTERPQRARPVRFGVISTARIGREKVIPGMMKSQWCDVCAIASRSLETARYWADVLGIPVAYGSYEELLEDPGIEAIYNPTPNHLHAPTTLAAARKGKHVLCEKPIALSAEEAETLRQAPPGILIAEAFMVRHHPQWMRARELVREGAIGEVRAVQVLLSYRNTDPSDVRNIAETGGGALYDIGCYAIATGRFFFSAEPVRAIALVDRDPGFGTDRLATAVIDFGGGRHETFIVGTQLGAAQRVEIVGSTARIALGAPYVPPSTGVARMHLDDSLSLDDTSPTDIATPTVDQYELECTRFAMAVRGDAEFEFGLDDGVKQMRVIDALFRSERSGNWERP